MVSAVFSLKHVITRIELVLAGLILKDGIRSWVRVAVAGVSRGNGSLCILGRSTGSFGSIMSLGRILVPSLQGRIAPEGGVLARAVSALLGGSGHIRFGGRGGCRHDSDSIGGLVTLSEHAVLARIDVVLLNLSAAHVGVAKDLEIFRLGSELGRLNPAGHRGTGKGQYGKDGVGVHFHSR